MINLFISNLTSSASRHNPNEINGLHGFSRQVLPYH